jgi:anti-sigma regulatory factor (Ser/Thr protein kinase)
MKEDIASSLERVTGAMSVVTRELSPPVSVERDLFTHHPSSVPSARRWARAAAERYGCSPAMADDVALVVSELTSNVVLHTPRDGHQFMVVISQRPEGDVLVEVHDASDQPPVELRPCGDEEGGRGLLLISAVARAWGTHRREHVGKVTWALVGGALSFEGRQVH